MLLNDILVDNKMRMPDTFKKSLVAAFGHLTKDDQKYILDHIEKFIPKESVVYFPDIKGFVPSFLVSLENRLHLLNYVTNRYSISVMYPATGPNDIIVANDIPKLYHLLWKENKDFAFISNLCSMTYERPRDLFYAFVSLSGFITKRELNPFVYPDAMAALAIYYDTITTLTINSIGLCEAYSIQTQTRAFSYMCGILKNKVMNKTNAYAQEILLLELNILTSLVPISEVKKNLQCLKSPVMVNEIVGEMKLSYVNEMIMLIEKRSYTDPFMASKFETYRRPIIKGISFTSDEKVRQTNNDLVEMMSNTTREKIKDLIEDKTGVIEELQNISFDIPEELLTMYQLEFSREYPIIMVPIPVDCAVSRDGSDWRHIIHYENDMLIAFFLKDSPKKLYAIHIYQYNYEDTNCTLMEFTGKENGTYEFVY